ncbi:MAG: transglutaminase-like domain-containing protein, partial [Verrucomicrobiales bacterium]
LSQSRSLPVQADLQSSHIPLVYLELDKLSQASAMSLSPIYVRSSTLGRYKDGEWRRVGEDKSPVWLTDGDDGVEDGAVTLPDEYPDLKPAVEIGYKLYARDSTGGGLLALQGVSEFSIPEVMRYDDDWYRARLFGNVSYNAVSRPLSFDNLLGEEGLGAGDPGGNETYLEVARSRLMNDVWDLLAEMPTEGLENRLLWLREFMADNYEYSTKIDNPDKLDPLENFLFHEKRGYCDFFATAGALIVRMMGVPSRIGYGYSKPEYDGSRIFTFHADGAHSWTEIFLEGHGWVVYDLTPRGRGGIGNQQGGGLAGTSNSEKPDLSDFDNSDRRQELAGTDGSGIGGGDDSPDLDTENSAKSDLVSYVVFCLALLMLALWYFLKRDPVREANQADGRAGGKGRDLPAYLAEFCQLVRSLGLDPQHGETLVEMLKALRGAGVPVDGFDAMKRYHYSTRYEDQPSDPKLEKRFLQENRQFIKDQLRPGKTSGE